MGYTRRLISFVILTMLVGLGSLVLSTDQARATDICSIGIKKVAIPADGTNFNFSATGGGTVPFSLMDNEEELFFLSVGPVTTVTEEVPTGWILDNIECTEPGIGCDGPCLIITEVPNGLTFDCLDDAAGLVTCTFTNVKIEHNVPTLSEWGLISMAAILGIVGFMVIRRKKVTA